MIFFIALNALSKQLPFVLSQTVPNQYDDTIEAYEKMQIIYDNVDYAEEVVKMLPWMENRSFLED